ncbi:MAG: hypothetical protein WDO13_10140 [Verrucomicrobiota bacterium]
MDDAVELVELGQALLDARAPLVEVKAVACAEVDAGKVPVAEELGDVRDLVGQLGHVDAEAAQVAQRLVRGAEDAPAPALEVVVGAVEVLVEALVHDAEFLELQVGQLQGVEDVVDVAAQVDDERRVPVDDGEVALLEGALDAQHLGDLRFAEQIRRRLGKQAGDFAPVLAEPDVDVGGAVELGDAEDGVGFGERLALVAADDRVLQAVADLGAEADRDAVEREAVVEGGIVEAHELAGMLDLDLGAHHDGDDADVVDTNEQAQRRAGEERLRRLRHDGQRPVKRDVLGQRAVRADLEGEGLFGKGCRGRAA